MQIQPFIVSSYPVQYLLPEGPLAAQVEVNDFLQGAPTSAVLPPHWCQLTLFRLYHKAEEKTMQEEFISIPQRQRSGHIRRMQMKSYL